MDTMPRLKHLLAQMEDAGAILRLVAHYNILLPFPLCHAAILRSSGAVAFYARTSPTPIDAFFGKTGSAPVPPGMPMSFEVDQTPERVLQGTDIVFAVGLPPTLKLQEAAETCDLRRLLDYSSLEEARAFVRDALSKMMAANPEVPAQLDARLLKGVDFVTRGFLTFDDPVRQQVERWILEARLLNLDLQTILDEVLTRGEDPLERLSADRRHDPWDMAQAILLHACAVQEEKAGTEQVAPLLLRVIRANRAAFVHNPTGLASICMLRYLGREPEASGVSRVLQELFATELLTNLARPETTYWILGIEMLGGCGLWNTTSNETIEQALVDLMARGGFDRVYAFLTCLNHSLFPYAWEQGPVVEPDQAQKHWKRIQKLPMVRAYLAELMPRVYKRALALGRLDVAWHLVQACPKEILQVEIDLGTDLANARGGVVPPSATILPLSSPDLLFRHIFLPAEP